MHKEPLASRARGQPPRPPDSEGALHGPRDLVVGEHVEGRDGAAERVDWTLSRGKW